MYKASPRLQDLLRSGDAPSRWLLVSLIALLPCLDLLAFTWGSADTAITRDQWQFLPMLRDYFDGHLQLSSLWETHSQHRTPGYKLLFLADASLFRLDMRFEIMVGLVALIAGVMLLMQRFRDSLPTGAAPSVAVLGMLSIALIGFNLNQWADLVYALTAFAGYVGVLCFIWLWCMIDTQARTGTSGWRLAWLALVLAFTLLVFAAGTGPAVIGSLLLVPAGIMLMERRTGKDRLMLLASLAACSLICELIYWKTGGMNLPALSQPFIDVLLRDPGSLVRYLLLAFASSLIPADAIARHFPGPGQTLDLVAGAAVMGLYVGCTYLYLRMRMWKSSYLPAFLMSFSTLLILSILVARSPAAGSAASEAPRYVLYTQLGLVGCLWILYQAFASCGPAKWPRLISPATCCMALGLLYAFSLVALWSYYPVAVSNSAQAVREAQAGDFLQPDWVCPNPALCKTGRTTLMEHRLNVFAAGEPKP